MIDIVMFVSSFAYEVVIICIGKQQSQTVGLGVCVAIILIKNFIHFQFISKLDAVSNTLLTTSDQKLSSICYQIAFTFNCLIRFCFLSMSNQCVQQNNFITNLYMRLWLSRYQIETVLHYAST